MKPKAAPAPGKSFTEKPAFTPAARTLTAESGATHVVAPIATQGWLEYTIPTAGANAEDMRLDPDGHLFFEEDGGFLGSLDPSCNTFVEYLVPSLNSGYYNIALAVHALWFAEAGAFAAVPTKVGVLFW